jgi:hypothetical protein
MIEPYNHTWPSIISVCLFGSVYLNYRISRMMRRSIGLYDFMVLSKLAMLPLIFVIIQTNTSLVAELAGVCLPFIIMFSALFVVLFFISHRLTSKITKLENYNRILVQDLAYLKPPKRTTQRNKTATLRSRPVLKGNAERKCLNELKNQ